VVEIVEAMLRLCQCFPCETALRFLNVTHNSQVE
jgi:hypothetical protein